jgi:hypothetical protein
MLMKNLSALAFFALTFWLSASAQSRSTQNVKAFSNNTGADLYSSCNDSAPAVLQLTCAAWVSGVVDGATAEQSLRPRPPEDKARNAMEAKQAESLMSSGIKPIIIFTDDNLCPPHSVVIFEQYRRTLVDWLERHPESFKAFGWQVVKASFEESWACPTKDSLTK